MRHADVGISIVVVREHGSVVSVPVALRTLFRIVLLLQSEEFCKLRIAAFTGDWPGVPGTGAFLQCGTLQNLHDQR
jgi:hypothetical protein